MNDLSPYKIESQKDFYYTPNCFLNGDDLEEIVEHIKSKSTPYENNGRSGDSEKNNYLDRKSWPIYPDDSLHLKKLYQSIHKNAGEANKKFNFDLDGLVHFVYMEYGENSDVNLDWHIDIASGHGNNNRKLSFSLMISDENEYEGGDLEIWLDPGKHEKITKTKGGIAFFPSFLLHRVTKVEKGTRRVIIGMYGGKPYR